ncbi:MAG: short-chain fatty acyl-CoA regulator family protein [Paracoccus sp. (in: a-proteobacteria)]|nr:short-chain fatty acyl-CoA regulator family protein [Paracoccus sp. (in: a-proteobacteria)]
MKSNGKERSVAEGTRIRERRLAHGRTQADLARELGISPAYLNLIEHDRRPLTADLRARLAAALNISEAELEEGRAEALIAALRVAAAGHEVEAERLTEFVARFPQWAGLLATLAAKNDALNERLGDLSDRMTQDPYLLTTLHTVLSAVTALRSTASILVTDPEMAPDWRQKFHTNLDDDSFRLSITAQALVSYLESFEADTGLISPQEEFEQWLTEGRPEGGLSSDAARAMAAEWAAAQAADRARVPDRALERVLAQTDDPARVAARLGAPLDLVLRRMGEHVEGAGVLICDGAGVMLYRRAARGMSLPRPGDRCTMLPIYEALGQPGSPVHRLVEMVGGQVFRCYAIAQRSLQSGFDGPALSRAVMLFLPAENPAGAGAGEAAPIIPIGPSCRICPRENCPARRELSIVAPMRGAAGPRGAAAAPDQEER